MEVESPDLHWLVHAVNQILVAAHTNSVAARGRDRDTRAVHGLQVVVEIVLGEALKGAPQIVVGMKRDSLIERCATRGHMPQQIDDAAVVPVPCQVMEEGK